jgi:hypothetical protein
VSVVGLRFQEPGKSGHRTSGIAGTFPVTPLYMCSPEANLGQPPRESFVIQLEEARKEWKRRNPVDDLHSSLSA